MNGPHIDAQNAAIARLTAKERECLRLWLEHKTAKQIALELGVSHHAVEKRLKMARAKLDVATSLDAARVFAQAEGYNRTVTASPDLHRPTPPAPSRRYPIIAFGGIAMFLVTVFALATALQPVEPDQIAVNGNLERVFELLDRDRNGFLENPESPFVTVEFLDRSELVEREGIAFLGESSDPTQIDEFYATADLDANGRISFDEYEAWSVERWAEIDIDISDIKQVVRSPES
ncbi:EF-hand domain-containing protein [Alteriqipengyuania lutimaris]|uniref:Histidine kinase n=1 Tax=Alteriqipengyuania lutimaris TaxID=1538146 RepID=A0A395LMS1_9SPHN|nr:EF-hand domain-containing protein [Alteriqipengyuania lutimaris]MBB3032643.1 DNA-binding CsgD family transcriptional regulator [Alteriqipengyuania lutimaris]RDS78242.1 histidine kinase [Alteriqipengyuania lutimaris]